MHLNDLFGSDIRCRWQEAAKYFFFFFSVFHSLWLVLCLLYLKAYCEWSTPKHLRLCHFICFCIRSITTTITGWNAFPVPFFPQFWLENLKGISLLCNDCVAQSSLLCNQLPVYIHLILSFLVEAYESPSFSTDLKCLWVINPMIVTKMVETGKQSCVVFHCLLNRNYCFLQ